MLTMSKFNVLTKSLKIACLLATILGFNLVLAKDSVTKIGDGLEIILPATAMGISVGREDMVGFWQLSKAELATILSTEALKAGVHSPRPNGKDNKGFPSGHTAITFTASQYLYERYGYEYGVPAYMLSFFVGYSRVHSQEHRWVDVIAGAGLGVISGAYFTEPVFGAKIVFTPMPGQVMVSMNKKW
jgi:membrane-associated phospholipid phosphatase